MNKQKWTEQNVKEQLQSILTGAADDRIKCCAQALAKRGLYKQLWYYWRKAFAGNEELMAMMNRIDRLFIEKERARKPFIPVSKVPLFQGMPIRKPAPGPIRSEKIQDEVLMMAWYPDDTVEMVFRDRNKNGRYQKLENGDKPEEGPGIIMY